MTSFRKSMIRIMLAASLALLASNLAAADKPLLMEGKKTLYQRVLSVPDARLYKTPTKTVDLIEIVPEIQYSIPVAKSPSLICCPHHHAALVLIQIGMICDCNC